MQGVRLTWWARVSGITPYPFLNKRNKTLAGPPPCISTSTGVNTGPAVHSPRMLNSGEREYIWYKSSCFLSSCKCPASESLWRRLTDPSKFPIVKLNILTRIYRLNYFHKTRNIRLSREIVWLLPASPLVHSSEWVCPTPGEGWEGGWDPNHSDAKLFSLHNIKDFSSLGRISSALHTFKLNSAGKDSAKMFDFIEFYVSSQSIFNNRQKNGFTNSISQHLRIRQVLWTTTNKLLFVFVLISKQIFVRKMNRLPFLWQFFTLNYTNSNSHCLYSRWGCS